MTDVNRTLRLRPPRNPVERRAIGWWAVQAVVVSIPVLAPLVIVGLLVRPARQWLLLAAALIGVVTLFYALVVPWIRYRGLAFADTAVPGLLGQFLESDDDDEVT
ncbi:hypothetical protein [Polymorphospora lycopeni]|uniref:DUF4175 domain-containing protein n=1 Tax=Polymorphospora lycopeni TaxID=3140240 RepID=A0ABV5CLW2_9ACTN